jgi:type II secretory pathway component PulJ
LIEVILAVGIAVGILVVALQFYRQCTDLRSQLLVESERIAAIRLVMDRIGADLRCAYATTVPGGGCTGDAASLRIVKTELPPRSSWSGGRLGRTEAPVTDLRVVQYGVSRTLEGTNDVVTGLVRIEAPLTEMRAAVVEARRAEAVVVDAGPGQRRGGPAPLTDAIRFVRFRYWTGSSWQDSWNGHGPPPGVEVSLGPEPLPADAVPGESPGEVYRRVIFVPGAAAQPRARVVAGSGLEAAASARGGAGP